MCSGRKYVLGQNMFARINFRGGVDGSIDGDVISSGGPDIEHFLESREGEKNKESGAILLYAAGFTVHAKHEESATWRCTEQPRRQCI